MAFGRERVLFAARNSMAISHVLCSDAHVTGTEGIVQGGVHRIDHDLITHPASPAHGFDDMGGLAHAFDAPGHREVAFTQRDHLRGGDDRLHTRSTEPVERESRGPVRNTRRNSRDARDIRDIRVARFALDDLSKHHMTDILGREIGALDGFGNDDAAKLPRGYVLQATAEVADCSARAGQNHNVLQNGSFQLHAPGPGAVIMDVQPSILAGRQV